jgi:cellulose synthase/poly-beta-1,6-N-acetylglucosamine synthase-like glycosyltransferase
MPSISVIVPVRNEASCIEETLRTLLTQDFPRDEFKVIVADGASTDETVPIVRRLQGEFANLRLVFNAGRLSSSGRNTAVRHASQDVVVVVDGHCHIPARNYLRSISTAFDASGADSLGRPQPLDVSNPTPFQRAVSLARSSRLGHNPGSDIYSEQAKFVTPQSTAVAYTRSVFHRVGLFDESFDACEDVEFNERVHAAGLTCYFTPSAKVVYEPRRSLGALFFQLSRYGLGRAKLAFKHPRSLTPAALVPPLWLAWLLVGAFLGVFVPFVGWAWLASVALYFSVLVVAALVLGVGEPFGVRVRLPSVLAAIHFGFAWGFWKEVVKQFRAGVQLRAVSPRTS